MIRRLALVLVLALAALSACTEVLVSPTTTDVVVSTSTGNELPQPTEPAAPEPSEPSATSLRFEDGNTGNELQSITIPIGTPVTVKVVALSESGAEIQSEDLTVTVRDGTVAAVKEIDGRFVSFSGLAPGSTSATVRAAGAVKELPLLVE